MSPKRKRDGTEAAEEPQYEECVTIVTSDDSGDDHGDASDRNHDLLPNTIPQKRAKRRPAATHLADDLRNLHEAAQLYKSNIFKLEIDELLRELTVDEVRTKVIDKVLHMIKGIIEQIPGLSEGVGPMLISEAQKFMKASGLEIPFPEPQPPTEAQYRFTYETPTDFNLVGQYVQKTMIKSPQKFPVDIAVTMPAELFSEKDIVNYRYFHKRAFYVAYMAQYMYLLDPQPFKFSYELLDGDHLRPVLRLDSVKDDSDSDFSKAKCYIRIIPCIDVSVFSVSKLSPTHNCVRYSHGTDEPLLPTPSYNSSILSDMQFFANTVFVHRAAKSCDGFKDACKLADIWLKQRGFSSDAGGGGFSSWEFSLLMACLLHTGSSGHQGSKILSRGFSNYQLFKATLNYLANTDLVANPVYMAKEAPQVPTMNELPVLINNDINLNALWRMSPSSYEKLRHEAALTVQELNDVNGDDFDSVFLEKVESTIYEYDMFITLKLPTEDKAFREMGRIFNASYPSYLTSRVYKVLKRGLGDRAKLISIKYAEPTTFELTARKPTIPAQATFSIGLILNTDFSEQLVIHGPQAEDKVTSAEFRKFWGRKSELRRFKDGSIEESVVWEPQDGDRSVCFQIVTYLMQRHFGENSTKDLAVVGDGLSKYFLADSYLGDSGAFGNFQKNLNEFEQLRKLLIDIDDLPLRVNAVLPTSARLRYASIKSPAEYDVTNVDDDFSDVVVELETSTKWPDDLTAVQHSKAAFLLGLSESITRIDNTITTRVGLDRDLNTIENFAFMDVLFSSGYAYRVRIQTDREAIMFKNYKTDKDIGIRALRHLQRDFVGAARHSTEFVTQCHRFPFLSPTVRRVKAWFEAHMLSSHIDDITIELLTLAVFLRPFPWTPPANATVGFMRVLYFLARWDWRAEPIILDLGGGESGSGMNLAEIQAARDGFKQQRANDPEFNQVAWFVAVNYEASGTLWTAQSRPHKVVASRVTALARASCHLLKEQQNGGGKGLARVTRQLFISSLADFDFVIHLKAHVDAGDEEAFGEEDGDEGGRMAMLGKSMMTTTMTYPPDTTSLCSPISLYLRELECTYEGAVLLFQNRRKQNMIAGIWDPKLLAERRWKVYLGYSTKPAASEGGGMATANVEAMVWEMARLGGNLVERVEITRRG
ncbi:Nrap protein [Limtongia smithiae]|uniref:Nrap protein n=1 Tax=Limtongia smithiae TaxID=1125753 RepID=UPI0034CD5D31